jgi:hypothetical protein
MDTSNDSRGSDTTPGPDSQPDGRPEDTESEDGETLRSEKTKKVLVDADQRDQDATDRDTVSDERARVADFEAFTTDGKYSGHKERRAAALDRADSKSDRESSAADRAYLTEDNSDDDDSAPADPTVEEK